MNKIILSILAILCSCSLTFAHASCEEAASCNECVSSGSDCFWWNVVNLIEGTQFQYCQTGCGMDGCGASVCAEDIDSCTDCLGGPSTAASGQYFWSPYLGDSGECVEDCGDSSVPADAPCYKGKSSSDPSGSDPEDVCPAECSTFDGKCKKCLENGCNWSGDAQACGDSCQDLPADADCWGPGGGTPNHRTCSNSESKKCSSFGGNCKKCIRKGCNWSGEAQACGDSCIDLPADADCWGPGGGEPDSQTCRKETECSSFEGKCKKCLRNGCNWSREAQACGDSCMDLPADADCWGPEGATPDRQTCRHSGDAWE